MSGAYTKRSVVAAPDQFGQTPLMKAARRGYVDVVRAILAQLVMLKDVLALDEDGLPALTWAATGGFPKRVKEILDYLSARLSDQEFKAHLRRQETPATNRAREVPETALRKAARGPRLVSQADRRRRRVRARARGRGRRVHAILPAGAPGLRAARGRAETRALWVAIEACDAAPPRRRRAPPAASTRRRRRRSVDAGSRAATEGACARARYRRGRRSRPRSPADTAAPRARDRSATGAASFIIVDATVRSNTGSTAATRPPAPLR